MTAAVELVGAAEYSQPPASAARLFWIRFKDDRAAVASLFVIASLILIATFGGPLAADVTGHPQNAVYTSQTNDFGVPLGPSTHSADGAFYFGADPAGRDLFVRTMYGARVSLIVGIAATAIAVFVGLVVGLIAGFFGGWVDTGLSRLSDVMLAVPIFIISIGIVTACSTSKDGCLDGAIQPGMNVVIVVIRCSPGRTSAASCAASRCRSASANSSRRAARSARATCGSSGRRSCRTSSARSSSTRRC